MMKRLVFATIVALAGTACASGVQPIDLHDQTIPIDARKLVADAEDSIAIARAERDEARRELERTREWKRDLLNRDWPSGASSAIRGLETMANARVRLDELKVERSDEKIDVAEAKYELITAKTAIRHDLAIYELEPLRKTLRREEEDVEALDDKIASQRETVAQKVDKWWAAYKSYAEQGGNTRLLYVSAAEAIERRDLREPPKDEKKEGGEKKEGEAAPDLNQVVDEELEKKKSKKNEKSEEGD